MGIYSKKMVYTQTALKDFSPLYSSRIGSIIVASLDPEKAELIKKKYSVLFLF